MKSAGTLGLWTPPVAPSSTHRGQRPTRRILGIGLIHSPLTPEYGWAAGSSSVCGPCIGWCLVLDFPTQPRQYSRDAELELQLVGGWMRKLRPRRGLLPVHCGLSLLPILTDPREQLLVPLAKFYHAFHFLLSLPLRTAM